MNEGHITTYTSTTVKFYVRETSGKLKPRVTGTIKVVFHPPIFDHPTRVRIVHNGNTLYLLRDEKRVYAPSFESAREILEMYQNGRLPEQ